SPTVTRVMENSDGHRRLHPRQYPPPRFTFPRPGLEGLGRRDRSQRRDGQVYRDKATGLNFERPGWKKLEADLDAGKVTKLAVWRLDRLGRTAGDTIRLLDDLEARKVGFVSLREGFDSSTPAGKLLRNILASVAAFETEVRSERQRAGIAAARAEGK